MGRAVLKGGVGGGGSGVWDPKVCANNGPTRGTTGTTLAPPPPPPKSKHRPWGGGTDAELCSGTLSGALLCVLPSVCPAVLLGLLSNCGPWRYAGCWAPAGREALWQ